jgi:alcohol dehydrogenase class IV
MIESPLSFEFATAARIIFREGACRELPTLAAAMGSRALVVTGSNPQRAMEYCPARQDIAWHFYPIQGGEPTVDCEAE